MKRMTVKTLLTTFCAISVLISCDTMRSIEDPDLEYFVKLYGGDGNQSGVDMLVLNDGTFLLLGNNKELDVDSDIYLLRVNAEGDKLWETIIPDGDDITIAKDLEPTADGNFIIAADLQDQIGGQTNLELIKVSPDGAVLGSVTFGTTLDDFSRTVTLLADGGFIVSGTTESTSTAADVNNPDPDLGDFFNYRFDASLVQLPSNIWSPVSPGFGGKLDVAVKAFQKPHPDPQKFMYYVFGFSNTDQSDNNPNKRLGLTYFRRDWSGGENEILFPGNPVNINDTEIQFVGPVAPQLGDGFVVIGTSRNNVGVSEIFVARLRTTLTFLNQQNDATVYNTIPIGRNIRGVSATSSLNGTLGFIVLGNEVRSTEFANIWVSKIDQSGAVLWSSTFGSEGEEDTGAAVYELPDGKIVIVGTMGLANSQSKLALIKINPKGELLK